MQKIRTRSSMIFGCLIILAATGRVHAAPLIAAGDVSGQAGSTVSVPVSFDPGGARVASFQFEIAFPPALSAGTVTAGPGLTSAGKSVTSRMNEGRWRFIVFGLNRNTIDKAELTLQVNIARRTTPGALTLPVSDVACSDATGHSIAGVKGRAGTITIKP
jgi:hypothetical protein